MRSLDTRTATPEAVMGQRERWGADLDVGGSFNRGNTDVDFVSSGFGIFRSFGEATAYLNGSLLYNTFGGVRVLNQGALTARYDHRMSGPWKLFVFNTEAYNEFLRLDHRATSGAGPWLDWTVGPAKSGTSLAVTHEYERFKGGLIRRAARFSLRHLSSIGLSPTARLNADLFYVPKADDFGDRRFSIELAVEAAIRKNLSLKLAWLGEHDSRPEPGVRKDDSHLLTALAFHFGE